MIIEHLRPFVKKILQTNILGYIIFQYFFSQLWNTEGQDQIDQSRGHVSLIPVSGGGSKMKIIKTSDYDEMSAKAAEIMAEVIKNKPACVLGLATGSTPVGLYEKLIEMNKNGDLDFSSVTTANLDEYVGLGENDDQSYRYFMNDKLFDHINIDKSRTFVPNGLNKDADDETARYEKLVSDLGYCDIQLLGLGPDGHIGFNEPADSFAKATQCIDLDPSTIEANKRFFSCADDVPKKAYTMGCGTIMKARKILMVVNGKGKAAILNKVINGPVCPQVPASILQFHPDVTIVADADALSETEF